MTATPLTPQGLMDKANVAVASARALVERGDVDGATNRAYYAMFDAARAALLASNAPVEPHTVRTHGGLIAAFGNHLVKQGSLSKDLGRLLNRAHEMRQVADYTGDSVGLQDASDMVGHAEAFLDAVKAQFGL